MPYSQLSLRKVKLSQRLDYHHDIDAYEANPQSQSYCEKFKNSLFRIRELRSKTISQSGNKEQNYNKYYIKPQLRYRKKTQDPKKKVLTNAKQSYLYDNLHNNEFWEWKHPFDKVIMKRERKSIQDQVNAKILQKFRQHLEDSNQARLPLVVKSVLQQKI